MGRILTGLLAMGLVFAVGCADQAKSTGEPVATTEDQYAAYDAMIAADQEQTAMDEAESAEGDAP